MNRTRKKRIAWIGIFCLVILIGVPTWFLYAALRQQRLNHALIAAIKENRTQDALVLLSAGADANARDNGDTPISVRRLLADFLDRLRDRRLSGDHSDRPSALLLVLGDFNSDGRTYARPENVTLMQALLDKGADINSRAPTGETALSYAVIWGYKNTTRLLLDHGADINVREELFGFSPLMEAVRLNQIEIARLLVDRGADINAKDSQGETALMTAADCGDVADVKLLLDRGADIHTRDNNGDTALLHATAIMNVPGALYDETAYADTIRILLEHKADPNVIDRDGQTPSKHTVAHPKLNRLLKQYGARR